MYYYRVLQGPTRVGEHNGARISYFQIMPAGEALQGNVPILACEEDLTDEQRITMLRYMKEVDIYYDDFMYEFRAMQLQKDNDGKLQRILLEVKNGIKVA